MGMCSFTCYREPISCPEEKKEERKKKKKERKKKDEEERKRTKHEEENLHIHALDEHWRRHGHVKWPGHTEECCSSSCPYHESGS
jgi:hypothetical protein